MKFKKLKWSNKERQFYYDVDLKYFLKVVDANDEDLAIVYKTTCHLNTKEETHLLFPIAMLFWPKQVAILFPRTSVDLHTYRKYHLMSTRDVACTMIGILNAIDYMHSKEYIHCDVKLENTVICLTSRVAKLIDFEYATKNSPITANRKEQSFGTIIAPEMKRRNWNNSIDFYCAGYIFRKLCKRPETKIFEVIYNLMLRNKPQERIGFTGSKGIKSAPIIEAIVRCRKDLSTCTKYSDQLIDTISTYKEETSSEIIEINLI